MVYLTGDYHGGAEQPKLNRHFFPEGQGLTREDYVIVLGDFGLPWDLDFDGNPCPEDRDNLQWLAEQPWTTLFIDGNHENHDYLDRLRVREWHGGKVHRLPGFPSILHLMRGQVFELEGHALLTMGGATSPDAAWRVEGETWFARELPSEAEQAACLANLAAHGNCVDYVLTHTFANRMLRAAVGPTGAGSSPWTDSLTCFLDQLEDVLGPNGYLRWYGGHFHDDRDLDERHALLYDAIVPLGEGIEGRVGQGRRG